ncbi:MAG: 5'-deoxy-5'-methylthioadenosine phosphorylase [Oleiphilaceae bacterium]|jgi:5'-deoxy-5'-methylthioadenosine phosphorylase
MIGIIGGTGLTKLEGLEVLESKWVDTPFGEPSAALTFGRIAGKDLVFLARHGDPHKIPPHKVNYRANISALKQTGVSQIIAVNAVGGIHQSLGPSKVAIPDQIIDYTYGREHTIYDSNSEELDHIDFSFPYSQNVRLLLLSSASKVNVDALDGGTYGATQGPRLETSAEIAKYKRDGCDLIGMTGMPEAALAREFDIDYACLALSVNWAAGLSDSIITMDDIHQAIEQGMGKIHKILTAFIVA